MNADGPERVYLNAHKFKMSGTFPQLATDVEYIHHEVAMVWVPIAEAGLQQDEVVHIWLPETESYVPDVEFLSTIFLDVSGCEFGVNEVSHILRIKPMSGATR